ncbi:MAG: HemK2/MTQ2 family protein methyltransferase [Steroidobacteraceae bacterium]
MTLSLGESPHRAGLLGRSLGRAIYWRHRVLSRYRLESVVIERVAGLPLIVLPGVLHPSLMRTGEFFASALRDEPLIGGAEVLDLGTGSGICALVAAERARRVTASDASATAVRCARINALLNRVDHRIDVLQGDLFGPVADRRFDLILFNPPFLRGEPRSEADLAWRSLDVPERFADGLRQHLLPAGVALLLLSSFGAPGEFLKPLADRGFAAAPHARRRYVNEELILYRVRARSPGGTR